MKSLEDSSSQGFLDVLDGSGLGNISVSISSIFRSFTVSFFVISYLFFAVLAYSETRVT
jgi:hypothetical protein